MAARTTTLISEDILERIYATLKVRSLTDAQKSSLEALLMGKDVFVGTKTGSGKSLTYEAFPVIFPGKSVVVIAPLVTIMEEQCKKLKGLGFSATYLGRSSIEDDEAIADGQFDFVFGSPELFLSEPRWRKVLTSKRFQERMGLFVIDEAHTVYRWGEGTHDSSPFREWFSKLGELRSLCPKAQMVALTATAGPTQRRKITRSLCMEKNVHLILDSADRTNIKISVNQVTNTEEVDTTFQWLFRQLRESGKSCPRHVIFCEAITDVSKVYTAFVREFGKNCSLFDMFHSKTNEKVKQKIRDDMTIDGNIRILICTNAAGMGVNFFGLYNIIHYGLPHELDTFVQQMGRAGRDGQFSEELVIFKPHKGHLGKVEGDLVKFVKDSHTCRHEMLCSAYLDKRIPIEPLHKCCDVCEKLCTCEMDTCPSTHKALHKETCQPVVVMERNVSESERALLKHKLMVYKYSLSSTNQESGIIESGALHGITDQTIASIVCKCSKIFSPNDIMEMFPIWSYGVAEHIFGIVCDIFGDTEMYAEDPDSS